MLFYIEHRYRSVGKATEQRSSPLEIAAEEFINGLLCHYEPPENKYLLEGAAQSDHYHDELALRRPPSILKTSRSFEKKQKKKGRMVRFQGINFHKSSSYQPHHNNDINKHGQRPKFLQRLACRKNSSF